MERMQSWVCIYERVGRLDVKAVAAGLGGLNDAACVRAADLGRIQHRFRVHACMKVACMQGGTHVYIPRMHACP
jgi:hypothetical protein